MPAAGKAREVTVGLLAPAAGKAREVTVGLLAHAAGKGCEVTVGPLARAAGKAGGCRRGGWPRRRRPCPVRAPWAS